jgi:hypothetical protein
MSEEHPDCRYFVTYTGVRLPLKLVNPLGAEDVAHRNTFIRGYFDDDGRLIGFQRVVYGDIELEHRYTYHSNGMLGSAEVTVADDVTRIHFDEEGRPLPA